MPYCILLPARLPYGILLQEENLVAIFDKALATTFFSNLRFFQAYYCYFTNQHWRKSAFILIIQ